MKDPLPSENDKDEAPTPPLMQDTLQLDRRARAMLKAMGIQWSWPSAPALHCTCTCTCARVDTDCIRATLPHGDHRAIFRAPATYHGHRLGAYARP